MDKLRLDKWLWAARFYKTRSLASEEITKGRVLLNQQTTKPAREVSVGDLITLRKETPAMEVHVQALSGVRGPAPVARLLYQETEASSTRRTQAAEQRRLAPEPALEFDAGRPTKKDRRQMQLLRGK